MNTNGRVVSWFSCGAASAVAAKLATEKYPDCKVVYCNTMKTEHPDNARFFADVSQWLGMDITVITSQKYVDVDEVIEKVRYMAGPKGAPCTREMKKVPRYDYQLPNDLHIFGLTADEEGRIIRFEKGNPDLDIEWILREAQITKDDCYQIVKEAGIDLPMMYKLGFKNNNCIGCVKVTSPAYWDRTRKHFPIVYERRVRQSRALGVKLIERQVEGKRQRMFLDELPLEGFRDSLNPDLTEEDVECGVFCTTEAK